MSCCRCHRQDNASVESHACKPPFLDSFISSCCGKPVIVAGEFTTHWYSCISCGKGTNLVKKPINDFAKAIDKLDKSWQEFDPNKPHEKITDNGIFCKPPKYL
jgi:hypothetical protein